MRRVLSMKKNTKNLDLKCSDILYKIFNRVFDYLKTRKITDLNNLVFKTPKKAVVSTPDL
jgi:hypothetical protein